MKNEGIEDILIGESYKSTKKSGGKIILFFLIFLLLVLAGVLSAYKFYLAQNTSVKKDFISSISNTNIKEFLNNSIYSDLQKSIAKSNFTTESNIKFTSTFENETFKDIDISRVDLNIKNINDLENKKSLNDIKVIYSSNELANMRIITDEENVALYFDEISEKYNQVAIDKIVNYLNYDTDINNLKNSIYSENLEFSDEEKNELFEKYLKIILDNLDETKFSKQDNIAIEKLNENMAVTAYSLKLTQNELNDILVKVLENINNDEKLLQKFSGKENSSLVITPTIEENIENKEIEDSEEPQEEMQEEAIENDSQEETTENVVPVITINANTENVVTLETEQNENNENYEFELLRLLFGKKLDKDLKTLQNDISDIIKNIKNTKGNGLEITAYVSSEKTEKIAIILPNENTIDVEFLNSTKDNENAIKITYLYKNEQKKASGFSVEINLVKNDASTALKAIYNIIENEEINKKIKLEATTNKTTSKKFDTDAVITMSTSSGETKVIIDNSIVLEDLTFTIEELTEENCVFLNNLNDEELYNELETIKNRVKEIYEDKKNEMRFIDTNTAGSTSITNISSNISKEEAQNALINQVSIMMGKAIENGEEFTIQNLDNLQIEGYEVATTITEEKAVIMVDVYTFSIDTNFTLTDVE